MLVHVFTRYSKMIESIEKYPSEYAIGDRIELIVDNRRFKVVAVGKIEEEF